MLTLVATPIGNLQDISERAIQAIQEADLILCEDTRVTIKLLNHLEIKKKLLSYHKFNEQQNLEPILQRLQSGEKIALVSDAGTPCINDPGQILVQKCHEEKIPVTSVPGPCSIIAALSISGFSADPFQFIGYLPKSPDKVLKKTSLYPGTTIALETPHRLIKTLKLIEKTRRVAIVREISKMYEECLIDTAENLLTHFEEKGVKGEIVLLLDKTELKEEMSIEEVVIGLQEAFGLSLKEAIEKGAKITKTSKREVYKKIHGFES